MFMANNIHVNTNKFQKTTDINFFSQDKEENPITKISKKEEEEIFQIKNMPNLFTKMAKVIAPSILGNIEVKKGILLMLFGGVKKKTKDKI